MPYKPTGRPNGRPKGSKTKPKTPEQIAALAEKARKKAEAEAKRKEAIEFGNAPVKEPGKSNSKNVQRLKDYLADFFCSPEQLEQLRLDMEAVQDPAERLKIRKEFFQFIIPKVTAVDMNATLETESLGDELSKMSHINVAPENALMTAGQAAAEALSEEKETTFS